MRTVGEDILCDSILEEKEDNDGQKQKHMIGFETEESE